jgi:hypothetical protein
MSAAARPRTDAKADPLRAATLVHIVQQRVHDAIAPLADAGRPRGGEL